MASTDAIPNPSDELGGLLSVDGASATPPSEIIEAAQAVLGYSISHGSEEAEDIAWGLVVSELVRADTPDPDHTERIALRADGAMSSYLGLIMASRFERFVIIDPAARYAD